MRASPDRGARPRAAPGTRRARRRHSRRGRIDAVFVPIRSMQVLAIIDDLVTRRGMGLIFISHDLNLVASFGDRVLIMYGGRVVETCRAAELAAARHPYTRGLLNSLPRIDRQVAELAVLRRDPAWAEAPPDLAAGPPR